MKNFEQPPQSAANQLNTKSGRDSNFELCRIVAITMVLILHTRFDGILSVYDGIVDASHICRFMFEALSIVGVNLFVLISGYFGIKLRWKAVSNFAFQVYWFAILGFAASFIFLENFIPTKTDLLKLLFPLSHNVWFVPCYFILMMISPILNVFVERTSVKRLAMYTSIIYILTFVWSNIWECTSGFGGYSWGFFIILYLTGASLRKWSQTKNFGVIRPLFGYLTLTAIIVMIALIQVKAPIGQSLLWSYDCPLVFGSSICLFLFFANCKLKYNKAINIIAASSFAVLLFHMSAVSRYFEVCERVYLDNSGLVVIFMTFIVVVAYFLAAFILDQPRKYIFRYFTKKSSRNSPLIPATL